jgi:pimeloyl-ACP methyl ester carboxylesterase
MAEHNVPDAPADIELGGGVAFIHTPPIPSRGGLALTHGAGGNCGSVLLQNIASVWAAAGFTVLRFDLPFRVRKAKGPPHPSRSEEDRMGIAAAVDRLRAETDGFVVFGGHSYGGRQGAMIASEQPGLVDGLVLSPIPCTHRESPTSFGPTIYPTYVPPLSCCTAPRIRSLPPKNSGRRSLWFPRPHC